MHASTFTAALPSLGRLSRRRATAAITATLWNSHHRHPTQLRIQSRMNSSENTGSGFKLQPPPSQGGASSSRPPRGRRARQGTESSLESKPSPTPANALQPTGSSSPPPIPRCIATGCAPSSNPSTPRTGRFPRRCWSPCFGNPTFRQICYAR